MSKSENRLDEIEKQIKALVEKAEAFQKSDPETAMWKARKACETICREVCLKESLIEVGRKAEPLDTMINLISKFDKAPRRICDDMRTIQWKGNTASHPGDTEFVEARAALPALAALANVTDWYFKKYGSNLAGWKHHSPDEPKFKEKGKILLKDPTFEKVAMGAMVGTAVALAAKFLGGNKNKEER